MDCNKVQELISLYLDKKLSSQEIIELEKHFDVCEKCKQDYITLKNIKNILSSSCKKEVSPNFTSSVMDKIKKEKSNDNVIHFGSIKKKFIMAAGFLFIVASSFFFVNTNRPINQQNSQQYESAIQYCLDYDYYNEEVSDYDEYEEYMLSVLY